VFNQGGTVTIANSTLTGNTAEGGTGTKAGSGYGGGLFNLNGTVTLTNATFAANIVLAGAGQDGGANGGAVYNLGLIALESLGGPSATATQNATLTVANCILANSGSGSVSDLTNDQGFLGTATINATGPNIVSAAVVNTGTLSGTPFTVTNPGLGSLANNGGPTPTIALLPGSPAISAGSNAPGLTTDQRGFGRKSPPDLGAFEFNGVPPAVVPPPVVPDRAIAADLVNEVLVHFSKARKHRLFVQLFVRVSFADTGAPKVEFMSPFQRPPYRSISVSVFNSDGDSVADAVRLTAWKGRGRGRTSTLVFIV
jgi:hypothetical protein